MTSDPLSEVLRQVRFRAAVFYYVNLGKTWAVEASPSAQIASTVMPGAGHVMEFHVVARGGGWACVENQSPVQLSLGDIVVFPHGDAHVLCSDADVNPRVSQATVIQSSANEPLPVPITYHGGEHPPLVGHPLVEAETILVCGFLGCETKPFAPFLASLPRLLHLPAERSSPWIPAVIDQAARESFHRSPGGWALLERLSEMMLVDTLRRYIDSVALDATGWLVGARDRYVGTALAAIHARPDHAWTVAELGRTVGLSRSALHHRFMEILGQTPGQYVARWRIQLGSDLLRNTANSVLAIAHDVGYSSEAAFSRAFKRIVGQPPTAWRHSNGHVGVRLL